MAASPYRFVMSSGGAPAELYLYQPITWWGASADSFQQELRNIGPGPLKVRINSIGGEVIDSIAIHSVLAQRPNTSTQIDGLAASAATIVSNAGQPRTIVANGFMMVHNPIVGAKGDEKALIQAAQTLAAVKSTIVSTYAMRSKKRTPEQISDLMSATTWMTAQQALDAGFVDQIIDPFVVTNEAQFNPEALAAEGVPEEARAIWGLQQHLTSKSAITMATLLESFMAKLKGTPEPAAKPDPVKPGEREAFLAELIRNAGIDPDEIVNGKDPQALAALMKGAAAELKQIGVADAMTKVRATLTAEGIELDSLKASLGKKVETEASRRLASMAAGRGIGAVKSGVEGKDGSSDSDKVMNMTERCQEYRKKNVVAVPVID